MSLVPKGLKIYYERKTKWTMVCQLAWTLEMILHFQETETSGAFFHHIRGLGLNYVMIGLSKKYIFNDNNRNIINQQAKCPRGCSINGKFIFFLRTNIKSKNVKKCLYNCFSFKVEKET